MSLKDLCSEFWDEIVTLMDYRVIEKMIIPEGFGREEALRSYFCQDPEFIYTLGAYLHLDPGEIKKEEAMLLRAS